MKRFVQVFAVVLVLLYVFAFLGGFVLFDIKRNFYIWMLGAALLLSLILWAFLQLSDQIDALQKRVDALEKAQDTENQPK